MEVETVQESSVDAVLWTIGGVILFALLVLVVVVGVEVKMVLATTTRLPPATGEPRGVALPGDVAVYRESGGAPADPSREVKGEPLRILLLGDSVMEGTAIDGSHWDAIGGHLARATADVTGRPVRFESVGKAGATAESIRLKLMRRLDLGVKALTDDRDDVKIDAMAISVGVNDLMRGKYTSFGNDLVELIKEVRKRPALADCPIAILACPPMHKFPALLFPLNRIMRFMGVSLFNRGKDAVQTLPNVKYAAEPPFSDDIDARVAAEPLVMFCSDGFHPNRPILAVICGTLVAAWGPEFHRK